jgi:hypothetical protein
MQVTRRVDTVVGDRRLVFADLTAVANGDTWRPGLQAIDAIVFQPNTATTFAVTTARAGALALLTFTVGAGTIEGTMKLWGT